MLLILECIILCIIFTILIIFPSIKKGPLTGIMSYPPAIRKRVEELPQYADVIKSVERKHMSKKIVAVFVFAFFLAIVAYLSGAKTFSSVFYHVFILSLAVNIYDLIVLDIIYFCHSKRSMIPGTEDMIDEYRKPWYHIYGALIGILIGAVIAVLSASIVYGYNLIIFAM